MFQGWNTEVHGPGAAGRHPRHNRLQRLQGCRHLRLFLGPLGDYVQDKDMWEKGKQRFFCPHYHRHLCPFIRRHLRVLSCPLGIYPFYRFYFSTFYSTFLSFLWTVWPYLFYAYVIQKIRRTLEIICWLNLVIFSGSSLSVQFAVQQYRGRRSHPRHDVQRRLSQEVSARHSRLWPAQVSKSVASGSLRNDCIVMKLLICVIYS